MTSPISSLISTPFSVSTGQDTQSQLFSSPQGYTGSDTEVETEYYDSDIESSTSIDMSSDTDYLVRVMESRLLFALCHDFDLACRLIPSVHVLAQGLLRCGTTKHILTQRGKGSEPQQTSGTCSKLSESDRQKTSPSHSQKCGLDPDDPDEPDKYNGQKSNRRQKRRKTISGEAMPTFACPFYKKDPQKYNHWNDPKYRTCSRPNAPHDDVRRLK